jgi:hypothetical protein
MVQNREFEVINGNNFAKYSNLVFSEELPTKEFEDKYISDKNIHVLYKVETKRSSFVWYIKKNFTLKENDVIFCNTEVVELLFESLKSVNSLHNLKLITHQSDRAITKKLFNKKPSCISHWYSTNVDYEDSKLTPIPLGVNDFTSFEYMNEEILNNYFYKDNNSLERIEKLYLNFNFNTNRRERSNLFEFFSKKDWAVIEDPHKDPEEYYEDIKKYKFVLCPWGNGYDTYRFWESLYLGAIPVTKTHNAYKSFKNLPAIFIKNYKTLTIQGINNKIDLRKEKLNINYWIKLINLNKVKSEEEITINHEDYEFTKKLNNLLAIRKIQYKLKIPKYYLSRYLNIKNYVKYLKK